jgi:hypothetical protein
MRSFQPTVPAAARARLLLAAAAAAGGALAAAAGAWGPPCTAETTCVGTSFPRCLDSHASGVGASCTLDYEYNETSRCSCGAQACVPLNRCVWCAAAQSAGVSGGQRATRGGRLMER